ncbi:MAG: SCP2 sterol-binding domain-containing protein [Methanomassiliicoccales archaeon]|jgi:putative sterol carrier protein|nr:SCP2 sterol-binding domain-containing protein [Methanomassiliicoccales archaeon]
MAEQEQVCRPVLQDTIDRFNERVAKDPELSKEVSCIKKKVQLDLGCESYYFTLDCGRVERLYDGTIPDPDITIISDPDTIIKLFRGEMKIMKAWALKKVKVKGSIDDVLKLRKFF